MVNGASPLTITEDYSTFLRSRGILIDEKDVDLILINAIDYLNNHENWLLIFDGCDYYREEDISFLQRSLPNNTNSGHIIITSRTLQWLQKAATIEVDVMSPETAVTFFETRIGNEDLLIPKLCQTLDYYPLALECAATYIVNTPGCTVKQYLKLLEEYGVNILNRTENVERYHKTVGSVLFVTLRNLREYGRNDVQKFSVAEFLVYAALLDSDNIDINLFTNLTDVMVGVRLGNSSTVRNHASIGEVCSDRLMRNELVSTLVKYSLVKPQNEKGTLFRFHPVLQAVIMNEFTIPEYEYMLALSLWYVCFSRWCYGNKSLLRHLCTLSDHMVYSLPYCNKKFASESQITKWETINAALVGIRRVLSLKPTVSPVAPEQREALEHEVASIMKELENLLKPLNLADNPLVHILTFCAYTESIYLCRTIKSPFITDYIKKAIGLAIQLLKLDLSEGYSYLRAHEFRSLNFSLELLIQEWLYLEDATFTIPCLEGYINFIHESIEKGQRLLSEEDYAEFKDTISAWLSHDVQMLPDSAKEMINIRVKKGLLPRNKKHGDFGLLKLTNRLESPKFITRT